MENKELSAKRATSIRRNSFEQTLPSEVRDVIDRVMPRGDADRLSAGAKSAGFAASAFGASASASPAARSAASAPRRPAAGMNWDPVAHAAASAPAPRPKPVPKPQEPVAHKAPPPSRVQEKEPIGFREIGNQNSGGFKKIALIIAAIAACAAVGIIAALKFAKGKDKPETGASSGSEISVAELSSGEDGTETTTSAPETTAASETTTTAETTTSSEETTTTATESETTVTEATTSSQTTTEATTTVTQPQKVTFSITENSAHYMMGNNGGNYAYQWIDDANHGKGLKTVTWMINVRGQKQANVYIKVTNNKNILEGELIDPEGVCDGYGNEKDALRINTQRIIEMLMNLQPGEIANKDFKFPANTNPYQDYWGYSQYYTDWVKTAQRLVWTDVQSFLTMYVAGK